MVSGSEAYGLQEPQLLAFQMAWSCLTLFKALFQTASRVVESKSQDPGGSKVAHRQWAPTLGQLWSRKQKQWRLRLDKLLQCFQVTVTSTQREGERERDDRNKKCNESVLKTSFTHRSTHTVVPVLLLCILDQIYSSERLMLKPLKLVCQSWAWHFCLLNCPLHSRAALHERMTERNHLQKWTSFTILIRSEFTPFFLSHSTRIFPHGSNLLVPSPTPLSFSSLFYSVPLIMHAEIQHAQPWL